VTGTKNGVRNSISNLRSNGRKSANGRKNDGRLGKIVLDVNTFRIEEKQKTS
jgi:hypothetical protein